MTASHWLGVSLKILVVVLGSTSSSSHQLMMISSWTQLTTQPWQCCLTWPLAPSTISQWGPSLLSLDHSVTSSAYTLLMVRGHVCDSVVAWCWVLLHTRLTVVKKDWFFGIPFLLSSVPSVPQVVRASSSGSYAVLVTWMHPTVFFRKYVHNFTRDWWGHTEWGTIARLWVIHTVPKIAVEWLAFNMCGSMIVRTQSSTTICACVYVIPIIKLHCILTLLPPLSPPFQLMTTV